MDISSLNSRISVLNAQVKKLNDERQVNIGRRNTLNDQLKQALEKYRNDYGVDLTLESLNEEYNRVADVKQAEVERLEGALALIQQGRYKEAEEFMGISPSEETNGVDQASQPMIQEPVKAAQPIVQEPVKAPQPMVQKPVKATPDVAPTVAPTFESFGSINTPTDNTLTGVGSKLPDDYEDDTPPAPPAPPVGAFTSFGQINSGASYKPQNV